jgi:hypothetical protein
MEKFLVLMDTGAKLAKKFFFEAPAVVLATGGIGKSFKVTSNSWEGTGDGHALALKAGGRLVDMEFCAVPSNRNGSGHHQCAEFWLLNLFVVMAEFFAIQMANALCLITFQMYLKISTQIMKQKQIVGIKIRTTIAAHQSYCLAMKLRAQLMLR